MANSSAPKGKKVRLLAAVLSITPPQAKRFGDSVNRLLGMKTELPASYQEMADVIKDMPREQWIEQQVVDAILRTRRERIVSLAKATQDATKTAPAIISLPNVRPVSISSGGLENLEPPLWPDRWENATPPEPDEGWEVPNAVSLPDTQTIQQSRAGEIKSICRNHEIDTLCHFTRIDNLAGILAQGILSRKELEKRSISERPQFNDSLRLDRQANAISLSISYPNYLMFYRCRQSTDSQWVVLTLRADVLWELDCAFCQENAASANVTNRSLADRKKPATLSAMFDEYGTTPRHVLAILRCYPTHPQAEVLVFDRIDPKYFTGVFFEDESFRDKWQRNLGGLHSGLGQYFGPRKDYNFWKKNVPISESALSVDEDDIPF